MLILSGQHYSWLQRNLITFPGRDCCLLMSPVISTSSSEWVSSGESHTFVYRSTKLLPCVVPFGVRFCEYDAISCLTKFQGWRKSKYHSWWSVLFRSLQWLLCDSCSKCCGNGCIDTHENFSLCSHTLIFWRDSFTVFSLLFPLYASNLLIIFVYRCFKKRLFWNVGYTYVFAMLWYSHQYIWNLPSQKYAFKS